MVYIIFTITTFIFGKYTKIYHTYGIFIEENLFLPFVSFVNTNPHIPLEIHKNTSPSFLLKDSLKTKSSDN